MKIKEIIDLISNAGKGKSNFNKGAVGSNGFGFVFRNVSCMENHINLIYTSRICNVGTMRKFTKALQNKRISDLLFEYSDIGNDLLYIGAIKTLVPSLEFSNDDFLFDVWMLVKTPEDKIFPATFYYSKSRLAIGGWNPNSIMSLPGKSNSFPKELEKYINFNPFELDEEEKDSLVSAIETALKKVPVSDFEVIFRDDYEDYLMAIKDGDPFFRRIREDEYWPIEIIDDGSWSYLDKFEQLIEDHLTPNDNARMKAGFKLLEYEILRREVIERCYDELVELAHQQDSRLAFQVLSYFLMDDGVKMTNDVKKLILKHSRWKDERHKLKDKEKRIKRRRQLFEFRAKILDYKEGTITF